MPDAEAAVDGSIDLLHHVSKTGSLSLSLSLCGLAESKEALSLVYLCAVDILREKSNTNHWPIIPWEVDCFLKHRPVLKLRVCNAVRTSLSVAGA